MSRFLYIDPKQFRGFREGKGGYYVNIRNIAGIYPNEYPPKIRMSNGDRHSLKDGWRFAVYDDTVEVREA